MGSDEFNGPQLCIEVSSLFVWIFSCFILSCPSLLSDQQNELTIKLLTFRLAQEVAEFKIAHSYSTFNTCYKVRSPTTRRVDLQKLSLTCCTYSCTHLKGHRTVRHPHGVQGQYDWRRYVVCAEQPRALLPQRVTGRDRESEDALEGQDPPAAGHHHRYIQRNRKADARIR